MNEYQVWMEGFNIQGNSPVEAEFLGVHKAKDFPSACAKALDVGKRDPKLYSAKNNTYWGCNFYDNEADARKSFG